MRLGKDLCFFVCVLLKNIYLFIWLYWVLVAAAQDLGVAFSVREGLTLEQFTRKKRGKCN